MTADALVSAELGKTFPIPAKYLLKHNQQISQQNSHYQVAREYRSSPKLASSGAISLSQNLNEEQTPLDREEIGF